MSNVKSLGNIWMIAATQLLVTVQLAEYKVFMDKAGQLYAVEKEEDAPKDANYVVTVHKSTENAAPFLSARLAHVAITHCIKP